jgi:hypothetical protein
MPEKPHPFAASPATKKILEDTIAVPNYGWDLPPPADWNAAGWDALLDPSVDWEQDPLADKPKLHHTPATQAHLGATHGASTARRS